MTLAFDDDFVTGDQHREHLYVDTHIHTPSVVRNDGLYYIRKQRI